MTPAVSPSREDPVVRAASEVAGGPAGARVGAGRHGFWTATTALTVAATATMAGAVLLRQHCRGTLWATPDQFTHACYSDIPALLSSSGMARGVTPYLEAADGSYLQQPVGTGGLLWLLSLLAPGGTGQPRWVFDLAVLLLTAALIATVVGVVRLSGRRPWDGALVALSPVLLTTALISLDLVAVALAVLGLAAFSRRRPLLAGVLIGLAAAVRPTALVVLAALALVALRSGRWGPVGRVAAGVAAGWAVVNVPVLLAGFEGWAAYWRAVSDPPIGYGSLWLLPQLVQHPLPAGSGRWLFLLGLVPVAAAALAFTLGTRYRPRLPAVVLLLVVGVLLVSPAVPVQASLWVLPFAALAVPRWRDLLVWGGVEVVFATVTWLYVYGQSEASRGAPAWLYGTLLVARLAAMAWLVRQAVVTARQPWRDPVRSPSDALGLGRDDPAAGDLEDAPDALVVRFV